MDASVKKEQVLNTLWGDGENDCPVSISRSHTLVRARFVVVVVVCTLSCAVFYNSGNRRWSRKLLNSETVRGFAARVARPLIASLRGLDDMAVGAEPVLKFNIHILTQTHTCG
jgi:hypothetical protein